MISKSVPAYVYLLLTLQVQARSKVVDKTANALDAQNIYINSFEELLKSDYSIADDIAKYQGVLERVMLKADFSVGGSIYMLSSNMNLNINKTQGFNNKILISESSYKLGFNNKVNAMAKPKTATLKKLRPHDREAKISVQNHNDEKISLSLLMTGTALVIYSFW